MYLISTIQFSHKWYCMHEGASGKLLVNMTSSCYLVTYKRSIYVDSRLARYTDGHYRRIGFDVCREWLRYNGITEICFGLPPYWFFYSILYYSIIFYSCYSICITCIIHYSTDYAKIDDAKLLVFVCRKLSHYRYKKKKVTTK